jgi:hypothetical protein
MHVLWEGASKQSIQASKASAQCPGRFLGTIGQDPSVSKANQLHVVILRFFCSNLEYIPQIPLNWAVILLKCSTSTGYSANSTGSSVTTTVVSFSPSLHPRHHGAVWHAISMQMQSNDKLPAWRKINILDSVTTTDAGVSPQPACMPWVVLFCLLMAPS